MCLVTLPGLFLLSSESEYEKLWYPTQARAWADLNRMWDAFGKSDRNQLVVMEMADAADNILAPQNLHAAFDAVQRLTDDFGELYTSVCTTASSNECVRSSVVGVWGYDWDNVVGSSSWGNETYYIHLRDKLSADPLFDTKSQVLPCTHTHACTRTLPCV